MTQPHSSARILEDLESEIRYRQRTTPVEAAAVRGELGVGPYLMARGLIEAVPALDCADLRATFQRSKADAATQLATLTRPQLVLQAWCYAAYLSEERGETVDPERVLENWDRGLARHAVAAGQS
jgi:hypothetical protein